MSASAVEAGSAFVRFSIRDSMDPGLRAAQQKLKKFGDEAGKDLNQKIGAGGLGKMLAGFGAGLAISGIGDLSAGIIKSVAGFQTAVDLSKELSRQLENMAAATNRVKDAWDDQNVSAKSALDQIAAADVEIMNQMKKARAVQIRSQDAGPVTQLNAWLGKQIAGGMTTSEMNDQAKEGIASYKKQLEENEKKRKEIISKSSDPFQSGDFKKALDKLKQESADRTDSTIAAMGPFEKRWFQMIRDIKDAPPEVKRAFDEIQAGLKKDDAAAEKLADSIKMIGNLTTGIKDNATGMLSGFVTEFNAFAKAANSGNAEFQKFKEEAVLGRLTERLSGDDQGLAQLVLQNFSNKEIMELKALRGKRADFQSRGELASSSLSRSLGIATSANEQKLTNEKLDEIRDSINNIRFHK